jgi:hypothetical protein
VLPSVGPRRRPGAGCQRFSGIAHPMDAIPYELICVVAGCAASARARWGSLALSSQEEVFLRQWL